MDFTALTHNQRQTWSAGDFSVVALAIMPVAEGLVAALDPHAGQRVLDVACGSGNVALVAARRYCEVTGIDFVPALLERARQRAAAEGTSIQFIEADAQALPFADHSFDFVLSTFGVMFAPDQQRAANELLRVCRPGGTIGISSWTPEGAVGRFFRAVGRHVPPAQAPAASPTHWGTEQGLRELFAARAALVRVERRLVTQYYRSVEHAVEVFRKYFGPTVTTFAALDAAGQAQLADEMAELFRAENRATDGSLAMPLEYLDVSLKVA